MDTILVFGNYKVRLFQRADQPSNYWFMRVRVENRPYRRTLKTCVLELARERATQEMIDILAKQKAGQKIFATTVKQFRDAYHLDQQSKATRREKSALTIKNNTIRIDKGLEFLKDEGIPSTRALDTIEGKFWQKYIDWRLKQNPDLRRDTLDGELVTIRSAFEWAKKKTWCTDWNIPQWELEVETQQATRDKIAPKDFMHAKQLIRQWVSSAKPGVKTLRRELVRTVFETISYAGFRTGELLKLRYKDIDFSPKEIIITVQDETTKVRKTRQVALLHSAARPLIHWLELRGDNLKPDDLVFLISKGKEASRLFYKQFAACRKAVLAPAGLADLECYHARHYCITNWLLAGNSIHLVAKLAGTSVAQIEKTYSGVIEIAIAREFAKRKLIHKSNGSYEITDGEEIAEKKLEDLMERIKRGPEIIPR
jgi:site-specific recombinase XerD